MTQSRLVKLGNLASIVRSKNAGPYRITLDVLFKNDDFFQVVSESHALNRESVAQAYGVDISQVSSFFEIPTARAFKATLIRPVAQCASGEGDVYGAQQHAPLLHLLVPVPADIVEYKDV